MISQFTLKFGPSANAEPLQVNATPVTVFVGPNNSGKSLLLREIQGYCMGNGVHPNTSLLGGVTFDGFNAEDARRAIGQITQRPMQGEALQDGFVFVGSRHGRQQLELRQLENLLGNPNANPSAFCNAFLKHRVIMLDGQSRISLINQQHAGDLQASPQSSLQVLFQSDEKRHEVRRIVDDAFGQYFVIDPTQIGQLRIRLSEVAPPSDLVERGIHAEAVEFHARARLIDTASDGVKAFIGIISELVAGDPRVLLIDEPEAFLHPALATKLGTEVARAAQVSNKRVFVSTHSPAFVMGCIQSGVPINIVRLTYRGGAATARLLQSDELVELMRNPLLRSTGLLSGLFYEFVVVTESDSDRAFYQEINERLLKFDPSRGIPSCLFLNAQNKQTIHTIMRPLRQLGIPAAGIVDIDVLKEGGANWSQLLSAGGVSEITREALAVARNRVNTSLRETGREMKRDGGLALLAGGEKEAGLDLLSQLSLYGIFVVPRGELEAWLPDLDIQGEHGPMWLVTAFERMGSDPTSAAFVRPAADDVWDFIGEVRRWLFDPERRGIPS